jgi:hypothetical protein
LRFRRDDLGRLLVRLELVALMKLELATLRKGVGSARKIFCDVGTAPTGGNSCCEPITDSCDGGIHGASRWMRPRMCCGMRSATASA